MKSKLIAGLIFAGGSLFAAPRISVGVGFGVPVPVAPAYVAPAYIPPCPGPDYVFIGGAWQYRPFVEHRDIVVRHDDFHRDFRHR